MALAPTKKKAPGERRKRTISAAERRRYYWVAFFITFVTINPLFLYRIPFIADNLYLDQWFGFASIWQQNDFGFSLSELAVWTVGFLPFYETIPFTSIIFDTIPKIMVGLVVWAGLLWAGYEIRRKYWIAFNNYNGRWAFGTAIKKVAWFGIPTAFVMLGLNYFGGIPFTVWNIVEVSLWVGLCILSAVVAVGLLWIFDLRYESGTLGVNTTMGDDNSDNDDPDHDDSHVDHIIIEHR